MVITTSQAIKEARGILCKSSSEMTLEQAVTKLCYPKPVALPYGITVLDLLNIMAEMGFISISLCDGGALRKDTVIKCKVGRTMKRRRSK